jgi:ankyrin repeat protein
MRFRLALPLLAVFALTIVVGAAPSSSPIADAAMKGNREAVRTLIQQGADVNAAQGDGMSALHWAADKGDAELTALLVYAGANPGAVTRIGQYTPLHLASRAGSAAAVQALLKAGAKVDAKTSVSGATPLHLAAAAGDPAVVTALLDAKADINAKEAEWEQTPLIFAASLNRVEAIKVLLARGADANATSTSVDLQKHIPLDRASNQRFAKVLEGTAGKNGKPSPNQLQAAVQASRELYASGKLPEPEKPAAGAPAAGGAGGQGQGGQQQFFEETPGLSSKGGLTALLHAARQGHLAAARALIDGGANVNAVSGGDGTSPLLMATINGHYDLAAALLARGADPRLASDAGATPLYGVLNMQWAPKARHPQPSHYMQQSVDYLDLAERFLTAGADVNARLTRTLWYTTYNRDLLGVDRTGATAFWLAAYTLDIPAMKLLLKHGADPNIRTAKVPERYEEGGPDPSLPDQSGLAPIPWHGPAVAPIHAASGVGYGLGFAGNTHRHVPDGWVPAVTFLVEELGADVNARDHNGYTPVHHAAARGDVDLIKYLVSKGADVRAIGRTGQTTVDMANGPVQRVQPYPEAIALLESLGAKNNHRCVSC